MKSWSIWREALFKIIVIYNCMIVDLLNIFFYSEQKQPAQLVIVLTSVFLTFLIKLCSYMEFIFVFNLLSDKEVFPHVQSNPQSNWNSHNNHKTRKNYFTSVPKDVTRSTPKKNSNRCRLWKICFMLTIYLRGKHIPQKNN